MTAQCFEMLDMIISKVPFQPHDLDSLLFYQTVMTICLVSYSHERLEVLCGAYVVWSSAPSMYDFTL